MNKLTKRLLSMAVVVVMVMAMLPTVFAADPVYTDWDGSASALVDGAYLKLTANKDVTQAYTLTGAISVTIDLNGNKITSSAATQIFNINNGVNLTLKNGTIEAPGAASGDGAVLYVGATNSATALTLDGVTVTKTNGTSSVSNGGVIYARRNVTLKNSTVQMLPCETHVCASGGLVYISTGCTLTIDNSTLTGGVAGTGGNIFATGKGKVIINSGSVTGGEAIGEGTKGHDLYTGNANVDITINGGTVGNIYLNKGDLIINGGTINEKWTLGKADTTVTVASGATVCNNPSSYVASNVEAYVMDNTTEEGKSKYTTYAKLADALAAAQPQNTVSLLQAEVTAGEVVVPAGVTLNIYGKTLNADSVSSASEGAQIKDSKGTGKIVSDSVTLMDDNNQLPVYSSGAYTFETVSFKENLNVDGNKATYKFYVDAEAASTLIDDAILADSGIAIDVYVTWTDDTGAPKYKEFTLDATMLAQYAGEWDDKMIVLTIDDLTGVSNLDCTAQVVSCGVTVGA